MNIGKYSEQFKSNPIKIYNLDNLAMARAELVISDLFMFRLPQIYWTFSTFLAQTLGAVGLKKKEKIVFHFMCLRPALIRPSPTSPT